MLKRLTSFGFLLSPTGMNEKEFKIIENLASQLDGLKSEANQLMAAIDSSAEYTQQGKQKQRHKLGEYLNEKMENINRVIDQSFNVHNGKSITGEMNEIQESMAVKKNDNDKISQLLTHMQNQEIRNLMRKEKNIFDREIQIRKHADVGNYSFLDAALSSPESSSFYLSDKTKDELINKRLRSENPEAAARLDQLKVATQNLKMMRTAFKQDMKSKNIFIDQSQPEDNFKFVGNSKEN